MRVYFICLSLIAIAWLITRNPNTLMIGDATHYQTIMDSGYNTTENFAFFPLFPIVSKFLGLVLTANISLLLAFSILQKEYGYKAVLAFGLGPCAFFFEQPYSEALFTLLLSLTLIGYTKNWKYLWVIIGLATMCRPVGVALVVPMVLQRRWWESITSCWGLAFYMLYQQISHGDALLFAKVQSIWTLRSPEGRWIGLLTLEPVWGSYVNTDPGYWNPLFRDKVPIADIRFMNPIYWTATCLLIGLGKYKGWFKSHEFWISVGLLLIPYVTKGYDNGLQSHGRFAAIVFPAYIVIAKLPKWLYWPFVVTSAAIMFYGATQFFLERRYY